MWIVEERRQHTRVAPLLRTRLFRIPAFSAGLTVQFGTGSDPWSIVPGLVVAGAGLSLLIIPLANVVLAAVPTGAAGGASGLFSTAQQFGGAVGIAVIGTVFFTRLEHESLHRRLHLRAANRRRTLRRRRTTRARAAAHGGRGGDVLIRRRSREVCMGKLIDLTHSTLDGVIENPRPSTGVWDV